MKHVMTCPCSLCRPHIPMPDSTPMPQHRPKRRPTHAQYRQCADEQYANDDCQIDTRARVSVADNGAWVHAWVWVYDSEIDPAYDEEDEP